MATRSSSLMTEGAIWKQILVFSIPLIIGNFFQQMYNIVDTLVIGNYLGGNALASVGAGTVIIHLLLSLFIGLSTGAGVVISQAFGAGHRRRLDEAIHTSAAFTLFFGVFMTIFGIAICGLILRWIKTPEIVMADAKLYLRIYFAGILPLMIYNMGAAVLRAVGDSRTPLFFLAVAMVVNTVLDILFVASFGMGVAGVGLATLIAQAVAAALVMRKLQGGDDRYRLVRKKIRIAMPVLLRILRIGIPAGFQQMTMSLSNLVVQSFINGFGPVVMAAWNVYNKVDCIVILPIVSFGVAMTTFTGQNFGAGLRDRVYKGAMEGLKLNVGFAVAVSLLFYVFAGRLLVLFTSEAEVIAYGERTIHGMSPFYFLIAIMYSLSGVINGAGYSLATMLIMMTNLCVLRIVFLRIASRFIGTIDVVYLTYIVSWGLCSLGLFLYYRKGGWRKAIEKGKGGQAEIAQNS